MLFLHDAVSKVGCGGNWVLMMPNSLGFCCLCSCPSLSPSAYLWCYLVLLSQTVSYASRKPVCQYSWETCSLWEEFRYGELWYRMSSGAQTETRRILSQSAPWFLCPDGSGWVPLGPGIYGSDDLTYALRCVSTPGRSSFCL